MIKKYNQYIKESLLNKLEGPSIDDVKQNISNINTNKLFKISIDNNDLELIKLIFEKKSFISFADKRYVMDLACEKKIYDIVKYLRNTQRIQIDLQIAAQFNDIKLFDIAEETSQYYNISEVFESALCYGNIDIIKYLLNKHKITKGVVKTAIKYVGKMFLSNDTENKKIKTIEYLFSIYDFTIEELKDINVLNNNVRNEINKEINKKKLTESLLNNLSSYSDEEAYQNLIDKYNNIDDIIFAAARADFLYGVKKALEEIEKYGNSGINYPNLILTDTIIYGSIEVLKYLIEEKDADIDGYYGHNLEAAASNDQPEIIKYLLSKGAYVHVNGDGPLWRAMSKGYVECAKYLLEGGAKLEQYMVNVVDKKNKPMLDLLKKYVVKESLLDKIEGPDKDEVWRNFGYEKSFDTPEEFLNYIVERLEKINVGYKFRWVYKDRDIFQYFVKSRILYISESIINLLKSIFNLEYVDILNLIQWKVQVKLKLPQIPLNYEQNRLL